MFLIFGGIHLQDVQGKLLSRVNLVRWTQKEKTWGKVRVSYYPTRGPESRLPTANDVVAEVMDKRLRLKLRSLLCMSTAD